MNVTALGENIRHLRKANEWNQSDFAKKLGVVQATVSAWEKGIAGPNPKQRSKLCEIFGIDLNRLYGIEDKTSTLTPLRKIPVISWDSLLKFLKGKPFHRDGSHIWTEIKGDSVFALQVRGTCMEPVFKEEDVIIIDRKERVEHNDYVVLFDDRMQCPIFRQYKKYGQEIVLHALDPEFEDIVMSKRYEIIGKVIASQRKH